MLPYLLLCCEDSPRREHELRTVFNAVRYVARMGGHWRFLPHDLPHRTSCISRCSAGSRPGASSCSSLPSKEQVVNVAIANGKVAKLSLDP